MINEIINIFFSFCTKFLKSCEDFPFRAHLTLDQPQVDNGYILDSRKRGYLEAVRGGPIEGFENPTSQAQGGY